MFSVRVAFLCIFYFNIFGCIPVSKIPYIKSFGLKSIVISKVHGSYKFNSLACEVMAPELGKMKLCEIKAIDRKHNMINLSAFLNKTISEVMRISENIFPLPKPIFFGRLRSISKWLNASVAAGIPFFTTYE